MNLGDFFSDQQREGFAGRKLKVGTVLKAFQHDTNPPKEKRIVIIGIAGDQVAIGVLFINSEINPNIFKTQARRSLHIKIEPDHRNIVDWTSYIDCSFIHQRDLDTITQLLTDSPECFLGELEPVEVQTVVNTLKASPSIPTALKRRYQIL